ADMHDDRAARVEGLADRLAERVDVVAVDDADVGQVELLEEEAWRPVGLDRLLDHRPEVLEPLPDAGRKLGEPLLEPLAPAVKLWVQAHAGVVAREGAD